MAIEFEVQNASACEHLPGEGDFKKWVTAALAGQGDFSLAVRIVDADEMRDLNQQYRGKDQPTNVLSFPTEIPDSVVQELRYVPLGDIVLCAPVVQKEAGEQNKPPGNHWAHLTIHGVLHLLGHDHKTDEDAQTMESIERDLLSQLGIPDPYRI